jgi:hypothetical protein
MSKKTMLAALTVSAALCAVPGFASGQEIHFEGISSFQGTGSASSLTTNAEPTLTCESTDLSGSVGAGGTTGSMTLDLTGCHASVFGITVKCRSEASALDNTVQTTGTFHLITYDSHPAVLTTPASITLVCAGLSSITVSGSGIATISSPACGAESKVLKLAFTASGSTQEDRLYTGVEHDLKLQTGSSGSQVTAATVQTWSISSETAGKLNCT